MERWRKAWRHHICLYIPTPALLALREGLVHDDPRLIQGKTVLPQGAVRSNTACRGACALGYGFWMAFGMRTVNQVFGAFEAVYESCDNEGRICHYFIGFHDNTPREKMRSELLAEVERTLYMRRNLDDAAGEMLADWLYAAERVYGGCAAPAVKGSEKAKAGKRKAAPRELVSC